MSSAEQAGGRQPGAAVRAEDIHKTYTVGRTALNVLRGASVSVSAGEAVAIVGISGAGKSTLLHILGGLDRPDMGQVTVCGENLYRLSSGRRTRMRCEQIGFVFQSYHLLPEMDLLENVMLPAMARRGVFASRRSMREAAMVLLEKVGLADRADHTPPELSGGEQQRAALARALMNDPQVVLADEPTGNLDAESGRKVLELLFALTRERGHTLVLVTHNDAIAGSCDRVLRLQDGAAVDS